MDNRLPNGKAARQRAPRYRGDELRTAFVARARTMIEKTMGRELTDGDILFFRGGSTLMDERRRAAENVKIEKVATTEEQGRVALIQLLNGLRAAHALLKRTSAEIGADYYLFALRLAREDIERLLQRESAPLREGGRVTRRGRSAPAW